MAAETKKYEGSKVQAQKSTASRKWIRPALGVLVLAAIFILIIGPKMKARQAVPPPASARAMIVKTIALFPQTLEISRNYTARISDATRTTVSARLTTTIEEVYFGEGDIVKAGDVLVLLNTQDVKTEMNRSKAALAKIEADIEFFEKQIEIDLTLYEGGAISKTAFDDATRKLKSLRASISLQQGGLKLSQQKLGYGSITAPVAGRIQQVYISKGEQVAPGKPVMEIIGMAGYRAVISIPERDMSKIALGNIAYIQTPDGSFWVGEIDRIYPALDERTHTGTVDVRLDDEISKKFFAGSMTSAQLVSAKYENILAVPAQAIFTRNGVSGVFVESGGTAHWKPVTIGASNGNQTIIDRGLSPGVRVITTPYPALNDGVKVTVAEDSAS